MSNLSGQRIQDTYGQVLTIANVGNSGLDSTLRHVQDGDATNSPLQLSITQVNISGELLISGTNLSNYITSGNNSGVLTGIFYPLNSNPSGYLTGFDSGTYVQTGVTGNFAAANQVVYITGDQNITGVKTFNDTVFITNIAALTNSTNLVTVNESGQISSTQFSIEAGETIFFLEDDNDPTISGYKTMDNPAQLVAESFSTQTVVSGGALIQSWITESGRPNTTFIPDGVWQFKVNGFRTGGTRSTAIYAEFYQRTISGTETLLGTTNNSILLTTTEVGLPPINVYIPAVTLLTTDRIVVKARIALIGGGSNPTSVTLGYAGTKAARISIPSQAVSLANCVPYTGATTDVDLGDNDLSAANLYSNNSLVVTLASGSNGGLLTDNDKFAQFNDYGQLNYQTIPLPDLNRDIDKRIYGLTANTGNKQIYSFIDNTTATYVRNTGCWAYGIDLTPISVWNSQGANQRGGILISPRHVLMAAHFPITGGLRWVTNNNQVVSGDTSGHFTVAGTDIRIAVLSGDVTGVSYAKVFSSGFTGFFNTSGIPVLFTDQEEKALVGQTTTNFSTTIDIGQSSNVFRSGFYETPIAGDSGGPICCVIGNEIVVVSTLFTTNSNPYISNYYNFVNTGISALGNSSGYQLTPVSLNYWPISYNQIKDAPAAGTNINTSNVVFTSGTQTISGYKKILDNPLTFLTSAEGDKYTEIDYDDIRIASGSLYTLQTRVNSFAGTVFNADINFTLSGNTISFIDLLNNRLTNGFGTTNVSVDWQNRILSGTWSTNTNPTTSGHLVNLGFISGRTGVNTGSFATTGYVLSGARAYNKQEISFFTNYVLTGAYQSETYIEDNYVVTGYKISVQTSGRGAGSLSSGASGVPLWGPLSGAWNLRQQDSATSTVLAPFSFNSGQLYTGVALTPTIVSGGNLISYSIFSGLSGIQNANFVLLGYLQNN